MFITVTFCFPNTLLLILEGQKHFLSYTGNVKPPPRRVGEKETIRMRLAEVNMVRIYESISGKLRDQLSPFVFRNNRCFFEHHLWHMMGTMEGTMDNT